MSIRCRYNLALFTNTEILKMLLNNCKTLISEKLFGLALLITSALYLRDLDDWAAKHACVETVIESEKLQTEILCSNLSTWRAAAIIGIVIVN